MIAALKNIAAAMTAAQSLWDDLALVRTAIEDQKARVADIESAPVPLAEAMVGVDSWMADLTRDAVDALRLHHLLVPGHAARGPDLPIVPVRIGDGVALDSSKAARVLFGLLAALQPEAMRSLIEGQLEDHLSGRSGMTAGEREKALQRARSELLDLERIEERLIRAMEVAGADVARRPDADWRAVLAHESALPK